MSVVEEVLEEEYFRSVRLCRLMREEYESLPKGSIRTRSIKGHDYYYLNYRVGDKVKSEYISAASLGDMRKKVARRKELKAALREQERTQKQIERALGRKPHVD